MARGSEQSEARPELSQVTKQLVLCPRTPKTTCTRWPFQLIINSDRQGHRRVIARASQAGDEPQAMGSMQKRPAADYAETTTGRTN